MNRGLKAALLGLAVLAPGPLLEAQYPDYADIGPTLLDAENNFPSICKRYDLGSSVQGRSIWALRISDNVTVEEDEPEFKYISTMHGDEIMGVAMCMNLIDYLLTGYDPTPPLSQVDRIVDEVEVWIVPLMNPDGYDRPSRIRYNANGVDLNRNFPDPFTSPNNTTTGRQPETAAIMNWSFGRSFTLAANYHGGALVANYPFDTNESSASVYTPTPDDDLFIWICEEYSQRNSPMWNSGTFYHGITNGADWYAISGGMQDWSYRYMGGNEITIEVSNSKQPPASQIPQFWNDNRDSMLAYIDTCLIGVRGIVTDADTGLPVAATVTVSGRNHDVFTDPDVGDYHRMVLPGTYTVTVEAPGYDTITHPGIVVSDGDATRWDVSLGVPSKISSPNGGEELTAGTATMISWVGSPAAQYHVQYTANANDVTVITDGFEGGSLDPAYDTGGDRMWFASTTSSHTGLYSAQAGAITHNEVSWMTRTVDAVALSFWYRVSSETSWDFFNFYIDGEQELHVSGQVGWAQYTTTLPLATYELKWEYVKDGSVSSGSDTAWIDDVELTVDNTTWTDVVALTPVGATSTSWVPPAAGTGYKVRVRAQYGDGSYGAWDESDETFTVLSSSGGAIPTVSEWGVVAMVLLMLTAGTVVFRRWEAVSATEKSGVAGCGTESALGSFQSTGRKPGGMLTQGVRRLAPAALTRRSHPAGSVTEPAWRSCDRIGRRDVSECYHEL